MHYSHKLEFMISFLSIPKGNQGINSKKFIYIKLRQVIRELEENLQNNWVLMLVDFTD